MAERWTVEDAAAHLGIAANSADKQLRRWGVPAVSREPGRGGRNLYDADTVKAAVAAAPGRGARTDLKETPRCSCNAEAMPYNMTAIVRGTSIHAASDCGPFDSAAYTDYVSRSWDKPGMLGPAQWHAAQRHAQNGTRS